MTHVNCDSCQVKSKCIYQLLSNDQKQTLNENKLTLSKKKGSVLYEQGNPAFSLIMVRQGVLKHCAKIGSDKNFIFEYIKQGDLIGLASLKQNSIYLSSAISLTEVSYCVFPNNTVLSFVKSNPAFINYFFDRYADYLKSAGNRIYELAKCPARNRVAKSLVMLNLYMADDKRGIEIRRADLAELVDMTRETLTRQLGIFKRQQLIDVRGPYIKVIQLHKLQEVAKCR